MSDIRIIVSENGVIDTDAAGDPRQYAVDVDARGFLLRAIPRSDYRPDATVMHIDTRYGEPVYRIRH